MSAGGQLQGKAAVVTGASSGIGEGIAEGFAREGADVAISGRDQAKLDAVAGRLQELGARTHVVAHDLAADEEPGRLVAEAREAFGAVNCAVHSAGVFCPAAFVDASIESFDSTFGLNVRAGFLLAQAAARQMSEGDSIIFISSIAGHVAFPNSVAYCGTKGAVELMVKAMCTELSPLGIRVNSLAPGNIITPINAELRAQPGYEDGCNELTPAGRFGETEEIADAAVFLASDKSCYVHGASLLVDGGWTAR
jgi:glucose 1-dehydrogenase